MKSVFVLVKADKAERGSRSSSSMAPTFREYNYAVSLPVRLSVAYPRTHPQVRVREYGCMFELPRYFFSLFIKDSGTSKLRGIGNIY